MNAVDIEMNAVDIEVVGLEKRFGNVAAVHGATFTAPAGQVTGFIGANGAGKSTTLRMLVGLTTPDGGSAHFGGTPYRALARPSRTVGAVLDIAGAHPSMTAIGHLRTYAALGGHAPGRIGDVISLTGLESYAHRRIRGFSTGMRQRLALATALLGDPAVLVLDEPSNGLDPAGIVWLRRFIRRFADAGGTVLISSHVLAELEQVVDGVVLIDAGRILWSGTRTQLVERGGLEAMYFQLAAIGELA
ncbi:ABC transporter ATP-binding protein [Agromyces laixinhei]|uniref:ABC transporter ATP-binding protein n=1 Tax=Agromyces laixinhei TaxID=2585717 RepID=UPI001E53741B|nr:ATP-binding cassette domain-containing protein [Agromyces laixinhei]